MKDLDRDFLDALKQKTPDFEKAKTLLAQGVNINAADKWRDSILAECLLERANCPPECDFCEEESCRGCEQKRKAHLIPMIEFFIENGWDSVSFGLNCIVALVHTTHDAQMFYAAKRILSCPLLEKQEAYESVLESIGTEESYQRCCEECHEQENLYYAMYELVEARMKGMPFEGIHPYNHALGKKIDRIVYFAGNTDFIETPRGTEFNSDFGFVCGDEILVVTSGINILFMNDRALDTASVDVSTVFGSGVVGATVVDIVFEHKKKNCEAGQYGQTTIIMKLDSGKELQFTHNFGELPAEDAQGRFLTQELTQRIIDRRSYLFDLCANTTIDLDKIEAYIIGSQMSSEDVTRVAIRLAEEFGWEVDSFKWKNGRAPNEDELITSNWLELFELFLKHGLDPQFVFSEDGRNRYNLLYSLRFIDNMFVRYKLFRLLFRNGADPNVIIDDESFFEKVYGDVVTFATLLEIEGEDRLPYEKDFRLWLLMIAYGGRLSDGEQPLQLKEGFSIDMLENCEVFSYRKEMKEDGWDLHIFITKTGEEVAVL